MKCFKCSINIADSASLKCSTCTNDYHLDCSSLKGLRADSLNKRRNSWLCNVCEVGI